jgi:hypothetical protein
MSHFLFIKTVRFKPNHHSFYLFEMIIHTVIQILLLGVIISCSQTNDSQLAVLKLQIVKDFNEMESAIRDSLAAQDHKYPTGIAVQKFFEQRSAAGSKGGCTVAVLDPHWRYIAGGSFATQKTEIATVDTALKNFQYLKESFEGLEKGRMVQNILYYRNDKIYVVAKALKQGHLLFGYLFFAYHEDRFKKDWEISEEQFLNIDFSKTD